MRSFNWPARVTIPTPITATSTPSSVIRPPRVLISTSKLPFRMGVISVPTIRVIPMAIPIPIDIPR
ncbi:hypothetical protein D3C78_1591920 [compost metagenome]